MNRHERPPEVLPRYATPRNPDRATDGGVVARYADLLGTPLIPWQRQVIDVISEIDPATGTYFYDTLVLTVQRQAGKTTITKAFDVRNAMWGPARRTWYLAQTGSDANDQFRELIRVWRKSRLQRLARKPRMSNGSMSLTFINGSTLRPGGATETAGHGVQGDLINVDEVWSLSNAQAKNLKDAFIPTTTTRLKLTGVRPQMWWTSTEGNASSEYFNGLLDRLRSGDIPRRTAFFDFGLPDGEDPDDLEAIWRHHPGAGWLFDFDQLRDLRDKWDDDGEDGSGGWARAYGNIRDDGVTDRAIDPALWSRTTTDPIDPAAMMEDGRRVCFGAAVSMNGLSTAIVACIERAGLPPLVQTVDVLPGIGTAPDRIRDLQARYHAPLCIDGRGPSAALADMLRNRLDHLGEPVYDLVPLSASDALTAPQSFMSALDQGAVEHARDLDHMDEQALVAAKRRSGDAWLWSRKDGHTAHVIEAATLAYWGLRHLPDTIEMFIA